MHRDSEQLVIRLRERMAAQETQIKQLQVMLADARDQVAGHDDLRKELDAALAQLVVLETQLHAKQEPEVEVKRGPDRAG